MKLTNEICISFLQGSGWLLNHDEEITISEHNKAIDDFVEYVWETTSSSDIEWITRDYELYDLLQKKAKQLRCKDFD